jgi:ribulose-phosphate 3-epimerase
MNESESPKILPSVLSADMSRLAEAVALMERASCELIHLDIMDGRFVPNLTMGPPVVKALCRAAEKAQFDVHLMIETPERLMEQFVVEGVRCLTVHAEASVHLHRTLQQIRALGCMVGVSLNPATPPETIEYILDIVDLVLVMTVNPGFGGQKYIEAVTRKIEVLSKWRQERQDFNYVIEVDGGIDRHTIPKVVKAGAGWLVAGNAVFGQSDPVKEYRRLETLARQTYEALKK